MCSYGYKISMSDEDKKKYEAGLNKFKELVDKGCEMREGDVPEFTNDDKTRAHGFGVDLEGEN